MKIQFSSRESILAFFSFLFLIAALSVRAESAHAEIIFSAKVLGPVANLYAVNPDSGDLRKITDNIRWRDLSADVNDRGAIVFSSNRESDAKIDMQRRSENFNLYIAEAGKTLRSLGGETTALEQALIPRFSPSGKSVAYIGRGVEGDRLMLFSGGEVSILLEADEIFDFSWSPDGGELAVAIRRGDGSGLWLVSREGEEGKKLSAKDSEHLVAAQWAPDGEHIAFILHPTDGPGRSLWVTAVDREGREGRENRRQISTEGREVQDQITWSSDGQKLLYTALVGYRFFYDEESHKKVYRGSAHIYESNLNGKTLRLSRSEGLYRAPIYSPDEKHIAYLYAERLEARSLSLRVADREGRRERELFDYVTQRSSLRWF